jgi:hypothetical protein
MVTMPIEGSEVFESLQAELTRARGELAECQQASARLDSEINDLLTRRAEALVQLARHFLPEISRPAIERTFEGIRADLMAILARREAARRKLQAELERADEEIREHNTKLDDVTDRLNEKVARREQLEARVAEILKGNEAFQGRSKLALQAEEQLHKNEQRVGDIAKEAAEKLPHYERSRLFRYLYDREFGTAAYKAGDWTRAIDGWIARLIGYVNARSGYEFLKKTPELVAAEVAKRRDQFNQLMRQVEALQHDEADKIGLTAVLREGEALGVKRDGLVNDVERFKREAEEHRKELAGLERSENQFYSEAIERFRKFLGETKVAVLQQRALQTPEPDDDAIVADLARLDQQIAESTPRRAEISDKKKALDRRQEGIDLIVRRYRKANFDSQRSYFVKDFGLRQALDQFGQGGIDPESFWQTIESSQRFRPHWVESTTASGSQVVMSPNGRVLIGAILDVANAALQSAAYRGVQRRGDVFVPRQSAPPPISFPGFPSPTRNSAPSEGGFTSGEGF